MVYPPDSGQNPLRTRLSRMVVSGCTTGCVCQNPQTLHAYGIICPYIEVVAGVSVYTSTIDGASWMTPKGQAVLDWTAVLDWRRMTHPQSPTGRDKVLIVLELLILKHYTQ